MRIRKVLAHYTMEFGSVLQCLTRYCYNFFFAQVNFFKPISMRIACPGRTAVLWIPTNSYHLRLKECFALASVAIGSLNTALSVQRSDDYTMLMGPDCRRTIFCFNFHNSLLFHFYYFTALSKRATNMMLGCWVEP